MNFRHPFLLAALLLGPAGVLTTAPARAENTATNSPVVASNAIPASVFDDNLTGGKDPFFPRSRRRTMEASSAVAGANTDVTSLILQGVSSNAKKPLATINNQTFTAGEEGEVITSKGRMRIRCEEIRGDSVVVSVGGQRMELRLPQR